jgi:hypothetical protein
MRVRSDGDRAATDPKEVFQIRQLMPESDAVSKRFLHSILAYISVRAKKRVHHIILGELIGEQIANISSEEIGKRLQFEPGDRSFALLDLHDNRPGDAEFFCDLVLRHPTRFACLPDAAAQFDLVDGHISS